MNNMIYLYDTQSYDKTKNIFICIKVENLQWTVVTLCYTIIGPTQLGVTSVHVSHQKIEVNHKLTF